MTLRFLALAVAASAAPAFAQSLTPTVWLEAGASSLGNGGLGNASFLSARGDLALRDHLVTEAGLGYVSAEYRTSEISYALVDVELQAQLPLGRVRPYMGVGVGRLIFLNESPYFPSDGPAPPDEIGDETTLAASVGARVGVSGPFHVRLGARFRVQTGSGPDLFSSEAGEVTLGAGYRF